MTKKKPVVRPKDELQRASCGAALLTDSPTSKRSKVANLSGQGIQIQVRVTGGVVTA